MDKEYSGTSTVANMRDNGKMTNNMGKAKKFGTMGLKFTQGTSLKAKSTARVNSCGKTVAFTRVTLLTVYLVVLVFITLRN